MKEETENNITSSIFSEVICNITEMIHGENEVKIKEILYFLINILIDCISPYLYTIIILLIIIFIMNCYLFYYMFIVYLKR